MTTASRRMRMAVSLLALALAAPAAAQERAIEVQPLEPLVVPGATQNNDGGRIIVEPIEPLAAPDGESVLRPAPEARPNDPLGEGFNDDAFGEARPAEEDAPESAFDPEGGSFIDRAFGTSEGSV